MGTVLDVRFPRLNRRSRSGSDAPAGALRWGRILAGGGLLWLAAVTAGHADPFWSNPYGTATLYDDGPLTTTLATGAAVPGGRDVTDELNYLDATDAPATLSSASSGPSGSLVSTAQLELDPGQLGEVINMGSINFTSTGTGGAGSSAISLFYLISVPTAATIDLSGIRSEITTAGSAASVFSLAVYQSDADGGKFGDAVLSFTGSNFDASGTFDTTAPYYLLEMEVSGNATPVASDAANFSFNFTLDPMASVPEPSCTSLLVGGVMGLALLKVLRRRSRPSLRV